MRILIIQFYISFQFYPKKFKRIFDFIRIAAGVNEFQHLVILFYRDSNEFV